MKRLLRLLLGPAVFLCLLLAAVSAAAQEAAAPAQSLGEQFVAQVLPQLIAAVGAALVLLVAWLRSKTAKAISESKMAGAAKAALDYASSVALELVLGSLAEAQDWHAELADGKITREEVDAKLAAIKAAVLAKLQDATIGRLLGSGAASSEVSAKALTDSLVESALVKAKSSVAASAAAAEASVGNPPQPPQG